MGRPDLAARRAWLGVAVAMVYMGACGVLFVVLRGPMIGLFISAGTPDADREELVRIGSLFLLATATFQLFDAIAMTVSGALRGAGDTVVPGVFTVILSWTLIVGGGEAMVRLAPGLASLGPWMAAASYIIVLSLFLLARFVGGRWRSIRLVESRASRAPDPSALVVDGIGPA
jgi:MATE family multidrug resistance protein